MLTSTDQPERADASSPGGLPNVLRSHAGRRPRALPAASTGTGELLHLATMLSQLDASVIELCTPGHRRGRGFTQLAVPAVESTGPLLWLAATAGADSADD